MESLKIAKIADKLRVLLFFAFAMSATIVFGSTWSDYDSYVISWYDKNQQIFEISSPQELAGLAYLVNNNFTSFKGKTIVLKNDIDLSDRKWIPIGIGNTTFQGDFDGNGFSISGIKIDYERSSEPYYSGFWFRLIDSNVSNVTFKGKVNTKNNDFGLIAGYAKNVNFENIKVLSNLYFEHPNISVNTKFSYKSKFGGMISEAVRCSFKDVICSTYAEYVFGSTLGLSCYGDIQLDCGGLVGTGDNNVFEKCHAVNNFNIGINGYVTTSNYTQDRDSFISFGGIIGSDTGNSPKIVSCLAENLCFVGNHYNGTFDTKYFQFGGIIAGVYENSTVNNCVAINKKYKILGHDYSWQDACYHTNSKFGGISINTPRNFGGCYSNNDVIKEINKVYLSNVFENGSTSFSEKQMNSQSFVDELNLYSQLVYGKDNWCLDNNGKLSLKKTETNSVDNTAEDNDEIEVYNVNGLYMGNNTNYLSFGIYIIRKGSECRKILVK